MAGFCESAISLWAPKPAAVGAKALIVSGRYLKYSRFRETPAGDRVRSALRIIGGYGALVEFLTAECRNHGVAVHLGSAVSAIEASNRRGLVRCANGDAHENE